MIENRKCGSLPDHINNERNWGYGYDDLISDLSEWSQSPFVIIDSIGTSVQGRGIWELIISDQHSSLTYKRVYIHARTHPGEEESFWVADEIINFLIADTPEAALIRANTIFHIVPMHNPDGVELGYARENANGLDIESGWDDEELQPEVSALQNRFIELSFAIPNPIQVALNMHSAYACKRYFVYHHENGTSSYFADSEKEFISGIQLYYPGGFENWNYYVSWSGSTPDQYPESWWWFNYAENVMALTYEDMNCSDAGNYNLSASAIINGICDFIGVNIASVKKASTIPENFVLKQNYPNPFNPITNINIELEKMSFLKISIIDIEGKEIKVLGNQNYSAGSITLQWDGSNADGHQMPSGIYYYRLKSDVSVTSKKMILIK
ncbi:MAG: M14 family zinc carboxypeptidase [Candidatus Neomarinimicrobiota bacterium]